MSDFTIANQDTRNLDSHKRVSYEHGMVLGVDEFLQEEIYLLSRDRRHNRGLHGYGTICGLAVTKEDTGANGWKITVHSGIGINPQGQEITVPVDQCAWLNEWVTSNSANLPASGPVSVDLVLCYRECKTDLVPVPSGPCQSLEKTMAASRIVDDFELKFTTDRPQHIEALVIRNLFDRLNGIEVSEDPTNFADQELVDYINSFIPEEFEAGSPPSSPPSSPPDSWEIESPPEFMVGSPPVPANMHVDDARRLLRLALRVWVTEVRPSLLAGDKNCASGPPDEQCLFLAEFDFSIAGGTVAGDVDINEELRPYLISTRAMQEHLLDRAATPDDVGASSHSALSNLIGPDDHPQYLRTDGGRELTGEWSVGNNKIINLANATDDVDAVPLGQVNAIFSAHSHAELLRVDGTTPLGGEWSAGNNKIIDLDPATDPNDAVNLSQLTDAITTHTHADFLLHDGSRALSGDLSANSNKITDLANATDDGDALSLGFAPQRFVTGEAGPFNIVAAGRFLLATGDPVGPVYNSLTARPVPNYPEVLNLIFRGYRNPTTAAALRSFSYVVRASFEGTAEGIVCAVVQVVGFGTRREGLFVRIVPIEAQSLTALIAQRGARFPLAASEFSRPSVSVEISEIEI